MDPHAERSPGRRRAWETNSLAPHSKVKRPDSRALGPRSLPKSAALSPCAGLGTGFLGPSLGARLHPRRRQVRLVRGGGWDARLGLDAPGPRAHAAGRVREAGGHVAAPPGTPSLEGRVREAPTAPRGALRRRGPPSPPRPPPSPRRGPRATHPAPHRPLLAPGVAPAETSLPAMGRRSRASNTPARPARLPGAGRTLPARPRPGRGREQKTPRGPDRRRGRGRR